MQEQENTLAIFIKHAQTIAMFVRLKQLTCLLGLAWAVGLSAQNHVESLDLPQEPASQTLDASTSPTLPTPLPPTTTTHQDAWEGTLWIAPGNCGRDPWHYGAAFLEDEHYPRAHYAFAGQHINLIPMLTAFPSEVMLDEVFFQISIYTPEGDIYFVTDQIPFSLEENTAYKKPHIPPQHVRLFFKPEDTFGNYLIETHFFAHQKTLISTKQTLELRPFALRGEFDGQDDFEHWMHNYYATAQLERAVMSYLYLAPLNFEAESNEDLFVQHVIETFYMKIFHSNPWMIRELEKLYANANKSVQQRILLVFAQLGELPPESPAYMSREKLVFWRWARDHKNIPTEPLTAGIQLDMLWADFFATGRYEPVRKILDCLRYQRLTQRSQDDPPLSPKDRQLAILYQLAHWSLRKNLAKHPLLKAYAAYTLEQPDFPREAHPPLTQLLTP